MRTANITSPWQKYRFGGHRGKKSACVVRYGAFGDMIQASSVFPALKEQGYSISVNTTTNGAEMIRANPYVAEVIIQEKDLVPNEELGDFWEYESKFFDKFINLSESVERSLIAVPGTKQYEWHKDFRDLTMGVDYLDATHAIAEVKDAPKRPFFFPSKKEIAWAQKYRAKLGKNKKVIMWALSGSSVHKSWPFTDNVLARLLLERKDVVIVMVGDMLCQILDGAWKNEKRVIRKCGKWSIRETLAFMKECDVVVGPETGVLNAASYEPMGKVLMLSHSSKENMGARWPNTYICEPECECYPCHKLHYNWDTCQRDEATGGAVCAASIGIDEVYNAIEAFL